jgi:tRNA-dihydrouridine synthase
MRKCRFCAIKKSMLWHTLKNPLFVLAPMADVTDPAFRSIIAEEGKPDALWTEFVSADGLFHTREKQKREDKDNPLMHTLRYTEKERPIIAQIFSGNEESILYATRLIRELGFDGVDINMGCPDKNIEKQGAGASLIKEKEKALKLIEAMQKGAEGKMSVSVKTRIGYSFDESEEWGKVLLGAGLDFITFHLRTRKEMSKVPARWEMIEKINTLKKEEKKDALIIGNGDVKDISDAKEKSELYSIDGVMIGRAIFGNPWLFSGGKTEDISLFKRGEVLLEQCRRFERYTPEKNFAVMKKHFKSYLKGGGCPLFFYEEIMKTTSAKEVEECIKKYIF